MSVSVVRFHVCNNCETVIGYREKFEHDAHQHDTETLELYRHVRGRGRNREYQWSTRWTREPVDHLEVVR